MIADGQTSAQGLSALLRSWNGDETMLTPVSCGRLVRLAARELGAPEKAPTFGTVDVDALAQQLRPLLPPNDHGQTMADVFAELRDQAARELKVSPETIRWETPWTSIDLSMPLSLTHIGAPDIGDFLGAVLAESKAQLGEPCELVGETVRCVWKARGGYPFWERPPYEQNWCAAQGVFYDFRRIPGLHQPADGSRVEPCTLLSSLVPPKEHGALLQSIETRFGVWLGRRKKEGCFPVIVAGVLASPLTMIAAGGFAVSITGFGSKLGLALMFLIYGACVCVAGVMYVRSQPRLPSIVVTVKDIVRAIVHKRRDGGVHKDRFRPDWSALRLKQPDSGCQKKGKSIRTTVNPPRSYS